MKIRVAVVAGLLALTSLPIAAEAQGLIGGAREGAHEGDRAAGPLGAVVGGAVGAGVGTVNGALGIRGGGYRHRCYYRHGHRHCR